MNENTNKNSGDLAGTSKINEYRPTKTPKVKMGAADVLGAVYDALDKEREAYNQIIARSGQVLDSINQTGRRVNESATRVEQLIRTIPPKTKVEHVFSDEDKATLSATSQDIAKRLNAEFWDFNRKLNKKLWWLVGGAVVTAVLAVLAIAATIKAEMRVSAADERAAAIQQELDSVRHNEQILWRFKEDNPKTWQKWVDSRGR